MESVIELRGLRLYSHHGCYAEERRVGCWFELDLDLSVECSAAAQSDDVADALNYVEVCQLAAATMQREHHLLEALARDLGLALRQRFEGRGLRGGTLWLRKLAPPVGLELRSVGIKYEF